MLESEIVAARRAYAASLGVTLSGAISNADEPVHIRHAVSNSNHKPQRLKPYQPWEGPSV